MGLLKPREERRATLVRARLRTDDGWSDVTIGNVSSRGLLLQGTAPLRRNDFVEVRHRHLSIVGRIVWAHGTKYGVRTQDRIDVAGLLSPTPATAAGPVEERRAAPRKHMARPRTSAAQTAEASKRFGRALDWTLMVVAAGAAGVFMAQAAWLALDAPLDRAQTAMASRN